MMGGEEEQVLPCCSIQGKKKKNKEQEKFLSMESIKNQLLRQIKMGRSTLHPRKHGGVTREKAISPLLSSEPAPWAGAAAAVTRYLQPSSLHPEDPVPQKSQGPLEVV